MTFHHRLCLAVAVASLSIATNAQNMQPLDLEFSYTAPRQLNQVAFVPFAGDTIMSPIILNDLNNTELTVSSQNLPQQLSSSSELSGSLPVWQQTGIPYLVIGRTQTQGKKIRIDYEVVDLTRGQIIKGKQSLTSDKDTQSMRYAAHVIADKVYELITGIPGDFSGRIAYIEERGHGDNKTSELKVMDADGENTRTITQVTGSIFSPAWSADGRRIAYAVQRPKAYPVIYIQDVDGGSARLVTPYKGNNLSPSFSPDGSQLLFSSSFEGNADIYQLHLATGKLSKLTNLPSNEIQPSYAPDGNSFVFVSDRTGVNNPQIYRYNFGSGSISRVSRSGSYAASPQVSRDGSQIAFLHGRSAAVMNSSGAIVANLGNTGIDEAPSFSPNGRRVVYASKQGGKGVLTIQSLSGGGAFSKSANGTIRSPVWSAPTP